MSGKGKRKAAADVEVLRVVSEEDGREQRLREAELNGDVVVVTQSPSHKDNARRADPAPGRASLDALAAQFVAAADAGYDMCADIAEAAPRIAARAWDGTLSSGITGEAIPLETAITTSTADLDKALYSFFGTTIPKLTKENPNLDSTLLVEDIMKAFGNLKELKFHEFRTLDLDNIQAVLTKAEGAWQATPSKNAVFAVQDLCRQLCDCSEGLRFE